MSVAAVARPRVAIGQIKAEVAAEWHLKVLDLESDRTDRAVARPRQVAMYLAKELTSLSLPHIGRHLGWRDHTTIIHGIRNIERLIQEDDELAAAVKRLRSRLDPPPPPLPPAPERATEIQFAFLLHGPLFDAAGLAA